MKPIARSLAWVLVCSLFGVPLACGDDDSSSNGPGMDAAGAAGSGGSNAGGTGGQSDGGEGGEGGEGPTASFDAFDAFREMQAMLRESPDHWTARAAALVKAKDAEGLFALVQGDIAVIPGRGGFFGAGTARRFGARATLRGGMGTMRERADLLRDLLEQAGFEAEVYVGAPQADFDLDALLARPAKRTPALESTAAQREHWASVLPEPPANFSIAPLDGDGARVNAVLDALRDAGVTADDATDIDWNVTEIPFVRATIDGEEVDLNPNVLGATFGEAHVLEPAPAPEAGPLDSVTVKLSIARANEPAVEIPVVEKTWTADEVAGRTVTAAFVTPHSFVEAAVTSAKDAGTFIPVLELKGPGLEDADAQKLSAVGESFTRGGKAVTLNEDGSLLIGDELAAAPPSDSALLASVESVEMEIDEAAFPEVSVIVTLRDGDGQLVEGLAADAFDVEEDGQPVQAVLRRSEAPTPKVVLLFDRSSSLPAEFLDNAAATGHTIAEAIFAAAPEAQIQIAGMDFNGPSIAGAFVDSLDEVDTQLGTLSGAASEVWTNLDVLAQSDATVVVVISDFDAEDSATAAIERSLADGPPVLAVAVGTADATTADRIASLTSGARVDGVDAGGVASAVAGFVEEQSEDSYRLVYRTGGAGTDPRSIHLTVDGARLEATESYTPPATPAPLPGISGVFVTVVTNGAEVKRVVAGTATAPASEEAIEQADAMLFGRVVLGVEAGPPSFSEKLDDHIGERLLYEPTFDAAEAGDVDAMLKALQRSRSRMPANLRFAFSAGPGEYTGPTTYPDGLSTALFVERPIWGEGIRRSLDWLPLVPRRTALRDPVDAFQATLRRTAYLSAIEAARFDLSTLSLLDGEPLGLFDPNTIDGELGTEWYAPVSQYTGRYIVAPTDGAPLAFFTVDRATGDIIGGLPDGTGGAVADEVNATLEQIEHMLSLAERAGATVGFNGISVWVQLERTKAQLVGAATIVIGDGEEVDLEDILADAAADAVAGAAEDAIGGEIPGYDEWGDLGDAGDAVGFATGAEMPDLGPPDWQVEL